MKYAWSAAGALLAMASVGVSQDPNCYQEKGNWYCSQIEAISYSNFGTAGQYSKVSGMDSSGQCNFSPTNYQGGMAPLDGEISWHFRGPIRLKQFAFYTPGSGSGSTKRSLHPSPHQRRHGHQHLHHAREEKLTLEEHVEEKRGAGDGDWIVATIDGKVVSWLNPDSGAAATPAPAPAPAPSPAADAATPPAAAPVSPGEYPTDTPASSAYSAPSTAPAQNVGAGDWGRQGYYNAQQGVSDGLVFLNHNGGQGSGVFDNTWGMSLSYASADNTAGSPSPVTLADTLVGDNSEFVIMTDKPCSNGGCGTVRQGTVAHHGFDGPSKLFLVEFSMPLSGSTGFNADMPAAWILNAQIPRTLQYGKCSCWSSGCGEFDIFEVLDPGNQKCKSTWHGAHAKGASNWFQRPTAGTQKAAVLLDGNASTAHIVLLPDSADFSSTISQSTLSGYLNAVQDPSLNMKVVLGA